MKILILNNNVPYPINSGDKVRTWSFINSLSIDHDVSLLCVDRNQTPSSIIDEVRAKVKNVWVVPIQKNKPQNKIIARIKTFNNACKGISWELGAFFRNEFNKKYLEILKKHYFDVILARYIFLGQYLIMHRHSFAGTAIIDLDDLEFLKKQRQLSFEQNRGVYHNYRTAFNNYILKRYHKQLDAMDTNLVCSTQDRDYLVKNRLTTRVSVIPNSIPVKNYSTVKPLNSDEKEDPVILFLGNLQYEPNSQGITWFTEDVFPLIKESEPKVKLYITGRDPEPSLYRLVDNKHVFIYANVAEVIPYYNACSLVIAPIFIAGGTRIKILEALACKRPVVATTVGAEGLELKNGVHGLIEDEPHGFADACIRLLRDKKLALEITENGYRLVSERYDSDVISISIRRLISPQAEFNV